MYENYNLIQVFIPIFTQKSKIDSIVMNLKLKLNKFILFINK